MGGLLIFVIFEEISHEEASYWVVSGEVLLIIGVIHISEGRLEKQGESPWKRNLQVDENDDF